MSRSATLVFAALALFLVLFPLALAKPGLPLTLKSDEPAYYLMALSLAHDRDLVCDVGDIARLGVEFPYNDAKNLILGSPDGWRTVYFGKPYLVSLVAAPMTALFGANGFVATNMALLLVSAWLGALWLRQWNGDTVALLFSIGFFVLSNAFAYVFWLHTEILCVASTTACLFFGMTDGRRGFALSRIARLWERIATGDARLVLSGAALVFGAYNKPYLAAIGIPVVVRAFRRRGMPGAAAWIGGAAAAGIAVCAVSIALIGKPTPYLGLARLGVNVDSFDRMPPLPSPVERAPSTPEPTAGAQQPAEAAPPAAESEKAPPEPFRLTPEEAVVYPDTGVANSFEWIFESFRLNRSTIANLGYFLVGRHTGLFPYAPFALLALLLFLVRGPRDLERWVLLASLAGIALYSLTFIWFNWHGGGGFIGNRYFVNALPGFLFLVTRVAPAWLPLVGYGLGALFVGGIVFTPFGAVVDSPTLQAHTRNGPFRLLPLEKTLTSHIPGYKGMIGGAGSYMFGRADLFRPVGNALWVVGGQRVDLVIKVPAPLARPVFEVRTFIAPNRVELDLGGATAEIVFESAEPPGNVTRVVLEKPRSTESWEVYGDAVTSYHFRVRAERQVWHEEKVQFRASKKGPKSKQAPPPALAEPDWETSDLRALVGASIAYLGDQAELDADVYDLEWRAAELPDRWPAGRIAAVPVRVRNQSSTTWRAHGAAAVALSYHWKNAENGRDEIWEGLRSPLPHDVEPGAEVDLMVEIETPKREGKFLLELDAVRERIAWFSERRERQLLRKVVEIVPPEAM